MQTPSQRYLGEKIANRKKKLEEERAEVIRIEEERVKASAPLITKEDLVGALGEIMKSNKNEVENNLSEVRKVIISSGIELNDRQVNIENTLKTLEGNTNKTFSSLNEELVNLKENQIKLNNEQEEKLKATAEEIKSILPKEKEITIQSIKGLQETLKAIAEQPREVSQPITTDIYAGGVLKKSGASKINIIGGTVTPSSNGVDITVGSAGAATWGLITGTLSAQTDLQTALNTKQNTLVSNTNIKTVGGISLLGSGDISILDSVSVRDVSANQSPTDTSGNICYNVDCTSGNLTLTLPTAVSNTVLWNISKVDNSANTLTVIGVVNGVTNPVITNQYDNYTLISNNLTYNLK